jgi:hypothetical protein
MILKAFLGGVVPPPPPFEAERSWHKPVPGKAKVNPRRTMNVTRELLIALVLKNLLITHPSLILI